MKTISLKKFDENILHILDKVYIRNHFVPQKIGLASAFFLIWTELQNMVAVNRNEHRHYTPCMR